MAKKKSFPLRIDPDLYEDLRRWAESEFRSVNGQIEYILRAAADRHLGRSGRAEKNRGAGAGAGSGTVGGSEGRNPEDAVREEGEE